MKERNLKDRLDDIDQPFDREALWQKIVEEKPRRRKLFYYIWLLPLLFGAITAGYVLTIDDRNEPTLEIISRGESSRIDGLELSGASGLSISTTAHIRNDVQSRILKNEKELKENVNNYAIDYEKDLVKKQKASSAWADREEYINRIAKADKKSAVRLNNSLGVSKQKPSSQIANIDISSTRKNLDERIDGKGEAQTNKLSFTERSYQYLDKLSVKKNLLNYNKIGLAVPRLAKIISIKSKEISHWSLIANLNYGMENYENADEKRIGTERELEAFGFSISLIKNFDNFMVRGGVRHTIANTELSQSASRERYLEGVSGATKELVTTNFNLYNTYQRTDAFIGLSYMVTVCKNFELWPTISLGSNILTSANGDFFKLDGSLQELSNNTNYGRRIGIFGSIGCDVSYRIADKLSLLVGVTIESQRAYTEDHTISPIYFHAGVAKSW